MPTRWGLTRQSACSDAPLVLGLVLVALAAWPGFLDPFTSVKWYALEAVAALWLVSERLLCGSRGVPSFVRRRWVGWVAFAAWVVGSSLRQGPAWAMAPLVARAAFAALAASAYWSFRRSGLRLDALRGSAAVAAAIVVTLGLLQMAGFRPMPWLTGGDQRSATFGNVNMTAQFVGLALVVLFSRPSFPGRRLRRFGLEALGVVGFGYLVLAGTRSVALALVAAFVALALARRCVASVARAGAALAVAAIVFLLPLAPWDGEPPGVALASKAGSARWRLAVWGDTLDLVRDHPLGVGAGNFEHAFVPYALRGRSRPGEHLVFRSPHNDYLRLVAEEGVPGAVLLLALLVLLARELSRSPAVGGWRSDVGVLLASCAAFLAVEALFQFPFELPFPALLAAVLLGLAFAAADAPRAGEARGERPTPWVGNAVAVLLAAGICVGVLRLCTAESLSATRRDEGAALERACSLDPRRVEACVQAAWLRSRARDHAAARRLIEGVLRQSPYYLPAIKLLAEDLLAAGEREAGCRYAHAYEAYLGGAGSLSWPATERCGASGKPQGR